MADNLGVPGGAAGPAATDEIGGAHYQRIKLIHGADGVNAGDVSDANPLPIDDAGGSLTIDNATLSVTGSGTQSGAIRATLATDTAIIGATNETAPASDTATSGLNGRLQRIAQRITSLIALLPASLGQKTMANSLAVVLASDQSTLPVSATVAANMSAVRRTGAQVGAASSGAYSTGVSVGSLQTVEDVGTNKATEIISATLYYESGTASDITMLFFGTNPTSSTFVDNTSAGVDPADVGKINGKVIFSSADFTGPTGLKVATKSVNIISSVSSGDIYVALVAGGAFDPEPNTTGFVLGVRLDA